MLRCRLAMLGLLLGVSLAAEKPARDLVAIANAGCRLTDEQARVVEAALRKQPDDAAIHAQLLGYCQLRKAAQRDIRVKSIFWMIQHQPGDPITGTIYCLIDAADDPEDYAKAKELWDQQLGAHSTEATVLANGAAFRATADFADAQGLLSQAASADPKNPAWPERAAVMDERRMTGHPDEVSKLADSALQQRQQAYNLTQDPPYRFHMLIHMPEDAMLAGNFIQAKHLARQLVDTATKFSDDPGYGDAIHRGNIVLGEESLEAGNVEHAEEFLSAAGDTPGSPTLATTGPDLVLAKKLLAHGERTAVRSYLAQCMKFWKAGEPHLKSWISMLDSGGMPDLK